MLHLQSINHLCITDAVDVVRVGGQLKILCLGCGMHLSTAVVVERPVAEFDALFRQRFPTLTDARLLRDWSYEAKKHWQHWSKILTRRNLPVGTRMHARGQSLRVIQTETR